MQFLRLPSSLGLINFPEWCSELRETSYLLDDQFIIKGCDLGEDTRGRGWRSGELLAAPVLIRVPEASLPDRSDHWPPVTDLDCLGGWETQPSNAVTVPLVSSILSRADTDLKTLLYK